MENKGLEAFEKALCESEELQKRYEQVMEQVSKEGAAQSDAEAVKLIAAELGYELSIEEIEQALASIQELDEDELENIAGGYEKPEGEDENGHDAWCWTGWHCHGITCHSDSDSHEVACWVKFLCMMAYRKSPRED